jgi:hypothetical protein
MTDMIPRPPPRHRISRNTCDVSPAARSTRKAPSRRPGMPPPTHHQKNRAGQARRGCGPAHDRRLRQVPLRRGEATTTSQAGARGPEPPPQTQRNPRSDRRQLGPRSTNGNMRQLNRRKRQRERRATDSDRESTNGNGGRQSQAAKVNGSGRQATRRKQPATYRRRHEWERAVTHRAKPSGSGNKPRSGSADNSPAERAATHRAKPAEAATSHPAEAAGSLLAETRAGASGNAHRGCTSGRPPATQSAEAAPEAAGNSPHGSTTRNTADPVSGSGRQPTQRTHRAKPRQFTAESHRRLTRPRTHGGKPPPTHSAKAPHRGVSGGSAPGAGIQP